MKVLIGNAWPYANGKLHLGRIVVFIPGDILARYHRKKGDEVIFISGSDAHGNLILTKAKEEGINPLEVVKKYHYEMGTCFKKLKFSFDLFSSTETTYHKNWVGKKILEMYEKGYIYEQVSEDGDRNLVFKLSNFEKEVANIFSNGQFWRANAKKITEKYINEGLRDRAVTKDINFGVKVPLEGFENKRIFVWIEALMGYLTATEKCLKDKNIELKDYFARDDSRFYLVHGKDNIPFHTIIFTGILAALGYEDVNLRIFSSNHLNLEGKKFSTIKNWAVWIDDILKRYSVDLVRYYLILNSPEETDTDFKWRTFINANNYDLVDGLEKLITNSVNLFKKGKCSVYKNKYEEAKITEYYRVIGELIEQGKFKVAMKMLMELIKKINEDRDYSMIKLVNIGNMIEPFLPEIGFKIKNIFKLGNCSWNFIHLDEVDLEIEYKETFEYIDKNIANEEISKLKRNKIKNLEYLQ